MLIPAAAVYDAIIPPPVCLEDRWSWGNAEAPPPHPQRVSVDLQLILATDEDACRARTFGVKQRYRGAFSPRRLGGTWRNERNEASQPPCCHFLP